MITLPGKYTTAKIMIDDIEPSCMTQIIEMVNHPAFVNPVSIMPDTHAGKGSVIGFTMPYGEKLVPNVTGVDLNCGMLSANIGKINIDFSELDSFIRKYIPFGMSVHKRGVIHMKNDFLWKDGYSFEGFEGTCKRIGIDLSYAINSIGTLGGGNHFIEFGRSESNGDIWVTIHSGSRNFGKMVCDYWQEIASGTNDGVRREKLQIGIEEIKRTSQNGTEIGQRISALRKSLNIQKQVTGLEYLEGSDVEGYLTDMYFTQHYARENRNSMLAIIIKYFVASNPKFTVNEIIETIHNFIDPYDKVIRKGAIRSYIGQKMIIPFNPHDGLLICEGKSNPEWNFSAPHGAGRIMSRAKAKSLITQEMADKAMEGVDALERPVDESPLVYKDSTLIEKLIEPTVKILDRVKPIRNLKAGDEKPWKKGRDS